MSASDGKLWDIVIVGGGVGGLNTAFQLLKQCPQIRLLLLEQKPRLGGRIRTLYVPGVQEPMELGPSRFSTVLHPRLTRLLAQMEFSERDMVCSGSTHDVRARQYAMRTSYVDLALQQKTENGTRRMLPPHMCYALTAQERSIAYVMQPTELLLATVQVLQASVPSETLRSMTWADSMQRLLGLSREMTAYLSDAFGYHDHMAESSAYDACRMIPLYINKQTYCWLKPGMAELIRRLARRVRKHGGVALTNCRVLHLSAPAQPAGLNVWQLQTTHGTMRARAVVLAVTAPDLGRLLPNGLQHLLSSVDTWPLTRVYAQFDRPWFKSLPSIVSTSNVRFFFPMDTNAGIVQIYSEGNAARYWTSVAQTHSPCQALKTAVTDTLRTLFPQCAHEITTPVRIWFLPCIVHHWVPHIHSEATSARMIQPWADHTLFICGEAYSLFQCWIEGALQTSDAVVSRLVHLFSIGNLPLI